MDTIKAYELFTRELAKHPTVSSLALKFDNSKRHCGAYSHYERAMYLSKPYLALASDDDILDTIRHEIAHALAGHHHGHDHVWEAFCAVTGAKPLRCGKPHVGRAMREAHGKFTIACMDCDYTYHYFRKPNFARLAMCHHNGCEHKPNAGKLTVKARS